MSPDWTKHMSTVVKINENDIKTLNLSQRFNSDSDILKEKFENCNICTFFMITK